MRAVFSASEAVSQVPLKAPPEPQRWANVLLSGASSSAVMSAFMLYVIGFIILLGGLIYGAYLIHVPQTWIIVGSLIVVGLGVMSAVSHTKRRDPPSTAPEP
jgi:hypothetical protein